MKATDGCAIALGLGGIALVLVIATGVWKRDSPVLVKHDPPVTWAARRPPLGCESPWDATALEPPWLRGHQKEALDRLERGDCIRLGPLRTELRIVGYAPEERIALVEHKGRELWVPRFHLTNEVEPEKQYAFERKVTPP